MSVIINTTMSEVESVIKYARYGANNCMIGNGWEIKELVRCKDCRFHEQEQPGMVYCPATVGGWVEENWFCKGGERRRR